MRQSATSALYAVVMGPGLVQSIVNPSVSAWQAQVEKAFGQVEKGKGQEERQAGQGQPQASESEGEPFARPPVSRAQTASAARGGCHTAPVRCQGPSRAQMEHADDPARQGAAKGPDCRAVEYVGARSA